MSLRGSGKIATKSGSVHMPDLHPAQPLSEVLSRPLSPTPHCSSERGGCSLVNLGILARPPSSEALQNCLGSTPAYHWIIKGQQYADGVFPADCFRVLYLNLQLGILLYIDADTNTYIGTVFSGV